MHPLVRNAIAEARRRGHEITLDGHLSAIMQLEQAARDTDLGDIQDEIDWLDRPVLLGHTYAVALYPLSFAGKLWIEEIDQRGWFANDPVTENIAIAWTLANSRQPEVFAVASRSEWRTRLMLKSWARKLDCPLNALLAATRRMMMPARDTQPEETVKADSGREAGNGYVGQIVARLTHEFGQNAKYWLYAPWSEVESALGLLRRDAEAMSKAMGKGEARDPKDPAVLVFIRWRKARQKFLDGLGPVGPAEDPVQNHNIEDQRPAEPDDGGSNGEHQSKEISEHVSTSL